MNRLHKSPSVVAAAPARWSSGRPPTLSDGVAALPAARQNRLLAALSGTDWERWNARLERVDLSAGRVLHESGGRPAHVYFPTTSIVSLQMLTEQGDSSEVALVGREGLVGVCAFMGGESMPSRAVVQSAGSAQRLEAAFLRAEFDRNPPLMRMLLRYTQSLLAQMAQMAVCNRHHTLEQQLCRRLLQSLDRLHGDEMLMTQEQIANLLGVRREGITEGARRLQHEGLIRYSRGRITVLDRLGLAGRSCECYAVTRAECDRLLPMGADAVLPQPRLVA